ncbi:hypothetical protein G9A89_021807 [Geosiphon pyriformis]|nr:hypothetical protein G9A89_021807 [Geosiphon pyriformis]
MQLVGLWQKSILIGKDAVHVVRTDIDKQTWDARNIYRTLLYTLLVEITAHDLWDFIGSISGKTCVIDHNPVNYTCVHCTIVCFESELDLANTIITTPVIKEVGLYWSYLLLALCSVYKNSGHMSFACKSVKIGSIFRDKKAPLLAQDQFRLAKIYEKKSALISCPLAFIFFVVPIPLLVLLMIVNLSLLVLAKQIGELAKRLNSLVLAVSQPSPGCQLPVTPPLQNLEGNIVIGVGSSETTSDETTMVLDSSVSSHIIKLENMLESLSASVLSLSAQFDDLVLAGVWKVATCNVRGINNPAKQDDIIHWHKDMDNLISIFTESKLKRKICLWIVNRFDGVRVFTFGLESGHLGADVVEQNFGVNFGTLCWCFLNGSTANKSFFIIFNGDFNENSSYKCASFKKCANLGLVNFLAGSLILEVSKYFDMDHKTVSMFVGLGGLLDTWLNFLYKQANKNWWKFNFKNAGEDKWNDFKNVTMANTVMFSNEFVAASRFSDLDTIWDVIQKVMVFLANEIFKKKWFKNNDSSLLKSLQVLKIVRASYRGGVDDFVSLMKHWCSLNIAKALIIQNLVDSGAFFDCVCSALFGARKSYRTLKLAESLRAKEVDIKSAIDKRMESFEIDKDHTIKSVLEHSFCKMVLDHLVIDDKLVLEPSLVKFKVDTIIEGWIWKHQTVSNPLGHIFDGAFSGVMCSIDFKEFFGVVSNLPDGKAAGLLGISNELWKYCDKSILDMLLSVLTNTCPIALIETAHKILSKILSDRISSACSTFDVLCGCFEKKPGALAGFVKHAEGKSLVKIKMCNKFIQFFSNIHRGHTNRIITNFGLIDGYCVYNSLDQGEVFSPLLWHVFYDPLLCKVKCQESVCEYKINSHFISKSGHTESWAGFFSFFAAVNSSRNTTQHILNVASEFFQINNISINNKNMVAIPINNEISNPSFFISGSPITIAKKGESHWYLGIFLSIKGFSKPSLAKAYLDVRFLTNLVLRKAVLNKQFLYLVLAVLYFIVSYRMQFSFVLIGFSLLLDFFSDTIHHSFFYGLKSFLQIQSESKIVSLVSFVNSDGILGQLFSYWSHDLQIWCWHPVYLLVSSVHTHVSVSNNFLTDMVCILLDCNLFLGGLMASFFQFNDGMLMSAVLGESKFIKFLPSLWQYDIVYVEQLCDHHDWFKLSAVFFNNVTLSLTYSAALCGAGFLNVLKSSNFVSICNHLLQVDASILSVYTNGFLKNFGTVNCSTGAAVFFENIGLDLGVGVMSLMSSTLAKLQAIVLALECIPLSSSVRLFLNSQSALDACKSELGLYWIERQHIFNVIHSKNLRVSWHKIKGHSGVSGNECANMIASTAFLLGWCLPSYVDKYFIVADSNIVSGNFRHFVHDIFCSVCHAYWEVGSGCKFLKNSLHSEIDWIHSSLVWHPDLHMTTGFTSRLLANAHIYLIKALHHHLPVAIRKRLYNRLYPSILCLYCGKVKDSHVDSWRTLSDFIYAFSCVLQLLSSCTSGFSVSMALFKGFKAVFIFHNSKMAGLKIFKFVHSLSLAFRNDHGLISSNSLAIISVSGLSSGFSASVVKLLGVADAFDICLSGLVSVYIAA